MQKLIVVDLTGQQRPFRMHEDAYEALRRYLDQSRARLGDDPDGGEVIDDLERSIGDRLATLAGPDDRVLEAADIGTVLDEVGVVEAPADAPGQPGAPPPGAPPPPPRAARRPGRRRLYRIREGQNIAGVCTGLAAYADLDVGLVRAIFVLLALFTAGAFILAYLVLMFVLPTVPTVQDWVEVQQDDVPRPS
jgi:phage shock protein PspC (stress-responsive transcriptional regulator)